ncbi:MAG: FtsX-like permease family protein [Lachnospiraceae bacterium]|nr:FtsX-like permease family protein [Lachnospiraceae bacterium]
MKKITESLAYKNLSKRPGKTAALIVLSACLSFSILVGTLIVSSLKSGLASLQDRLGADIMVVPYEAITKSNLENIVLQGNTGYFYMDSSYLDKIAAMDGIGEISAQFYLASTSSGCCSVPVQIIGFDPETDFTITPWIRKSYGGKLQNMDIVVGNDLNAFVGDTLTFYGTDVHVAAKLEKTGTSLDTAVYTNEETIKKLIQSSLDKKLNTFEDVNPDHVISNILINVADGYTVEEVLNDINIHVRKVEAVRTKSMISGIAGSLQGVSEIIGILAAAVWLLAFVILVIAFAISVNGRRKEFAVLRTIGASRKKVSRIVMTEGLMVSVAGSLSGVALGILVIIPFSNLIESQLSLPFLLPAIGVIAFVSLLSFGVAVLAGTATSYVVGSKIGKADAGNLIKQDM